MLKIVYDSSIEEAESDIFEMRYLGTKVRHGSQSGPDDLPFTVNFGNPLSPLST